MNCFLLTCALLLVLSQSFKIGIHSRNRIVSRNLFGNPEPPKKDGGGGGGGLFGGMGNMVEQMKKVQEAQKEAEIIQNELKDTVITGQDPSGQVFASFNGLGAPIGIKVSDSILAQGSEAVSIAASQAMVDAHMKSVENMMNRMKALYGGMLGKP